MKRRRLLGSLAGVPVAAAALRPGPLAAAPQSVAAAAADEMPRLAAASTEESAAGVAAFFTAPQLDALGKLAAAIMPSGAAGRVGAAEAGVADFLDFLVRESPKTVQDLYLDGLNRLAREGVTDATLAPLKDAWTYAGPSDRFAQFLQRAKMDIIQATTNSREWAEAQGRSRRGSSPSGYYWRSLD